MTTTATRKTHDESSAISYGALRTPPYLTARQRMDLAIRESDASAPHDESVEASRARKLRNLDMMTLYGERA